MALSLRGHGPYDHTCGQRVGYCPACHEATLHYITHKRPEGIDMHVKHLIFCDSYNQAQQFAKRKGWMVVEWEWISDLPILNAYPCANVYLPDFPINRLDHEKFVQRMVATGRHLEIGEIP